MRCCSPAPIQSARATPPTSCRYYLAVGSQYAEEPDRLATIERLLGGRRTSGFAVPSRLDLCAGVRVSGGDTSEAELLVAHGGVPTGQTRDVVMKAAEKFRGWAEADEPAHRQSPGLDRATVSDS